MSPLDHKRLDQESWTRLVDSEDLNLGEPRVLTETEIIPAYPEDASTRWTLEEIRRHLLEGGDRTTMTGHQPKVLKVKMHRFLMNVGHGTGGSFLWVIKALAVKIAQARAASRELLRVCARG